MNGVVHWSVHNVRQHAARVIQRLPGGITRRQRIVTPHTNTKEGSARMQTHTHTHARAYTHACIYAYTVPYTHTEEREGESAIERQEGEQGSEGEGKVL